MLILIFLSHISLPLKEDLGPMRKECAMSVNIPQCRNLIPLVQQRVHCGSTSDNVISLREGGALKEGKGKRGVGGGGSVNEG